MEHLRFDRHRLGDSMVGFPQFFGVANGSKVLEHQLYQKWNDMTIGEIIANDPDKLKADLMLIRMTNDNMEILWYLYTTYGIVRNLK